MREIYYSCDDLLNTAHFYAYRMALKIFMHAICIFFTIFNIENTYLVNDYIEIIICELPLRSSVCFLISLFALGVWV